MQGDLWEVVLRLGLATLCGLLIGINRDAKEKTAGMRTLALVALGASLVTLAAITFPDFIGHPDAMSRALQGVVQGVLAGIGFIGAGAILRKGRHEEVVHGVTTAATVWMAATLGIVCGLADWSLVGVALVFVFIILIIAKPIERWILLRFGIAEKTDVTAAAAASVPPNEPGLPPH
ncbi:MgtC/SapB family protein [Kaistia dalseonensis]|uniref:Protein MgtC n=1 Tax=Kaistia dalseonensis TaxID=410840 RepID=A0ABU0H852_9HYPH|nr:MgtC/SapB family protein [Kaistia dalseonensis]MCX5495886.1 MgtC/SapB family protein [Kaistia dalseonensis]MDQ0438488.1 putative Mg2+ transporter-C (MgtC) family protein [Kaistia dalseonensis]